MDITSEEAFSEENVDLNVQGSDPLVSDRALVIFQYISYCTVNELIDVFGVLANIVNIICFIKQGFKDSVNVSLFGLAISDLGCLVTLIWLNISMTPAFLQADLEFQQADIQYLTASWPHVVFSRISSFITAFITLERCLCITVPLKVKSIFTSKRVTIIIVTSFVICILGVSPVYCVNICTQVFYPERNKSLMAITRTDDHTRVEQVMFTAYVVVEFVIYITVIVCTAILTSKLRRKTKWRQSVACANSDNLRTRDQKIAKMILIISTVFIISFIIICVTMVCITIEPELAIDGLYKNTLFVLFGCGAILESINSSVNIFIYYNMSSKYRATFRQIFGLLSDDKQDRPQTNSSHRLRELSKTAENVPHLD